MSLICSIEGCSHLAERNGICGTHNRLLYDVRYFMPVCRKHHQYIETHPQEAYEKGWSFIEKR